MWSSTAFFVGFPFVAIVVNVPQRAQAVSGLSPLKAGLALLPLLLASPFATALSGFLTSNLRIPPFYLVLAASVLQLIGVGLSCSYPSDQTEVPPSQYGFEVIMGIGFGLGLTTILTFARAVVEEKHMGKFSMNRRITVAIASLTPLSRHDGCHNADPRAGRDNIACNLVILPQSHSICILIRNSSTILNNHVKPRILSVVSPEQVQPIYDSLSAIRDLTPSQQAAVKRMFAEGYNLQNIFMTAVTALGLITACFLWERHPRKAVANGPSLV